MKIQINGQDKEVSAATVAELVEQLGLKGDRVAIELNRDIVSRAKVGGDSASRRRQAGDGALCGRRLSALKRRKPRCHGDAEP